MLVALRAGRVDGVDDLVRLAGQRGVERAADTLRVTAVKGSLPRGGRAANLAVDVVEQTATPRAGSLVRWHGGVHDVDTPFNVAGALRVPNQ